MDLIILINLNLTATSALFDGNDEQLEALWRKEYPLSEFTDETKFKSFDDLKSRLDRVLNSDSEPKISVESSKPTFSAPNPNEVPFEGGQPMKKEEPVAVTTAEDEDDESLSYFQKLADEG